MAIDPTLLNLKPAGGNSIKLTPTPASPQANLSLGGVGVPTVPGVTNKNVLPPSLGGPAVPVVPVAPVNTATVGTSVVPQSVAAPTPVRTVTTAYTGAITSPPAVPTTPAGATSSQTTLGASVASYGAAMANAAAAPVAPPVSSTPSTGTGSLADTLKQLLTLNTAIGQKGDRTNEVNSEYGIDEKTVLAQKLSSDYNAKSQYYDKLIEKAQKQNVQGKSAQGIQEQVDQLTRQKNSELADISIQHATAVGDLKVANDLAKNKIDAEFEPLQSQIDNLKTYYSLAANDLSESEKLSAQAAIDERQSKLDEDKSMRLAAYTEQIKQNSPLYKAQVANELRLANGGGSGSGGGTENERAASTIAQYAMAFVPGATTANGTPTVDGNGFITPSAWKAAIADAPTEGLTRSKFIEAFGSQLFTEKGVIPPAYGLTPAEQKLILGELPETK